MLILSRKQEESIVIGDEIIIKVIGIEKGSVKLGFEAPPKTLILRGELKQAIKSENEKANMHHYEEINFLSSKLKLKRATEINAKDRFKMGIKDKKN